MNKSEELCKLLGIEYKTVYNDGIGGGTQAGIYPNLTKPSNFVKLYEMKSDELNSKMAFSLYAYGCTFDDRDSFIRQVIEYIEDHPEYKDLIKQQAQQIEWEY